MISLQNRLALTHALYTGAALGILALAINLFTGMTFNTLVKQNIREKSREIVWSIGELYDPIARSFDGIAVEAIGMYFVHDGYIVTVKDGRGEPVWDARSCDMQQCAEVINDISSRMTRNFRLNGAVQVQSYPVQYGGGTVGEVSIETYGPFFYSETETQFLASMNRLLLVAGFLLALLSAGISLPLSQSIAKPVLKAGEAARRIARIHRIGAGRGPAASPARPPAGLPVGPPAGPPAGGLGGTRGLVIRINDRYRTRELQELSRSINELAAELEEGERRQKQLSADIAHELRTPLTCLQGNMEAMIDGVYKPGREQLKSCHEEIIRLTRLVEDLHTLTGLEWETVELNKTCFDLADLVRAAAGQFRAAAEEKGIVLNLNLEASPVHADYDRLKQVLMNLFSNAVKYTDRGSINAVIKKSGPGSGRLDGGGPGPDDGALELIITETGIGIPADDLPHVFERFYRTDKSRSRSTGGAGIGLAIAAAIVQAHGGKISAESSGAGTTFRVQLY
jgi:signal transduction histidine kinase